MFKIKTLPPRLLHMQTTPSSTADGKLQCAVPFSGSVQPLRALGQTVRRANERMHLQTTVADGRETCAVR